MINVRIIDVGLYPFIQLGGERHCECLTKEHNAMSKGRACTHNQTARSTDEHTNHEAKHFQQFL